MNAPDPHHWTINSCFGVFHSVWVHLGPFHYCTKLGAKWAEHVQFMQSSYNEVSSQFFTRNTHNPHHWTLNSCFVVFRSVCVHLGPLHYCTKLVAKWAEYRWMQKFEQWSCIEILRNECIPSTPLDPKLMFWCVSYCLHAFGTVMLLHGTRCKTGKTGAINPKVRATKLCRNFSQWMHPIHTIGS